MKKSKLVLMGILGVALVFGLVLTGCPTDDDPGNSGPGDPLPEATGTNELSGKTYFNDREGVQKIEFAADGAYKKFAAKQDEDWNYVYDDGGKYTYTTTETENGSYSWDDSSKKVVLKPAEIAQRNDSGYGALQDTAGYRQVLQARMEEYKEEMGEAAFNEALASTGFSSVDAYIDYGVNEAFANKTFGYAFAANGEALLLSEELPSTSGGNELDGQTFSGTRWDSGQQKEVKDTNKTYTFSGTSYTYTNTQYTGENESGTYAWNTQGKRVYLKPATIGGKTNVDYFTGVSSDTGDAARYNNATDYRAARTNARFTVQEYPYDLTEDIVGYVD